MNTNAYAIKEGGQIKIETVSPNERGAKVNWLCVNGWMVYARVSDAEIDQAFGQFQKARDGKPNCPQLVPVAVLEGAA
ncbi:hypothetical protein [Brucella anthropi]|uniref:hypothetical protein n=1 Tax=Brucella anthropi TaxID=529 RepID=UPI000F68CE63|nr:hypothetical protein [Brucella anthropi]RRY08862.1 hypothetical protein EGJ58_13270 [Brucella anthropi]